MKRVYIYVVYKINGLNRFQLTNDLKKDRARVTQVASRSDRGNCLRGSGLHEIVNVVKYRNDVPFIGFWIARCFHSFNQAVVDFFYTMFAQQIGHPILSHHPCGRFLSSKPRPVRRS